MESPKSWWSAPGRLQFSSRIRFFGVWFKRSILPCVGDRWAQREHDPYRYRLATSRGYRRCSFCLCHWAAEACKHASAQVETARRMSGSSATVVRQDTTMHSKNHRMLTTLKRFKSRNTRSAHITIEGRKIPTRACEIDRRIVNEAEKMAAQGYVGTYTFKNYGKLGLHLRVRGNQAVWLTKFKQSTKTIGQLYPRPTERPITSVKVARETAANVQSLLKSQPKKFDDYMTPGIGGWSTTPRWQNSWKRHLVGPCGSAFRQPSRTSCLRVAKSQ